MLSLAFILPNPHPLKTFTPTPSSFSEQGKEWLPPIESARTLLSLFSLQKHAHVTLTFFIFFSVLVGENTQTWSSIWYTIAYGPTALIFPPPEMFGGLTEAKQLFHFFSRKHKSNKQSLTQSCCWIVSIMASFFIKREDGNWKSEISR